MAIGGSNLELSPVPRTVQHMYTNAKVMQILHAAMWDGPYLEDSSKEGSGVGEASQPVADGVALVYPALQLVQPLQQVACPGTQGLQTGVRLEPGWWHLHTSHIGSASWFRRRFLGQLFKMTYMDCFSPQSPQQHT